MRQPFILLLLGAALEQCLGQDFRPGDQTARRAQRPPRQLFRDHDHAQIVFVLIALNAAEAFRNGNAEATQFLKLIDDGSGNVEIVAVNLLGQRHHHFLGHPPESFAHHLVMVVQQIGAGHAILGAHQLPQFGHPRRRQLRQAELPHRRMIDGGAQPLVVQPEIGRAGTQPVADRLQGLGGEQQGEAFFQREFAGGTAAGCPRPFGVIEREAGAGDLGAGQRQVVADQLMLVEQGGGDLAIGFLGAFLQVRQRVIKRLLDGGQRQGGLL